MGKIRNLKTTWATLPYKRFIKVFAIASFGLWLGFVFLFYAISQNTPLQEEEVEELLSQNFNPPPSPPPATDHFQSAAYETQPTSKLSPLDLYAHRDLLDHLQSHGELSRAIPHLERVFPEFRGDSNFVKQAAEMFQSVGKYKQALRAAKIALEMNPGNTKIKSLQIMGTYRSGNVNESMNLGNDYLEKHPDDPHINTALGTILTEQDPHSHKAGRLFRKALSQDPEFLPARYQLGRKHQLMGNFRDALIQFTNASKIAPLDGKVRGQLGMAYYHLRRDRKAEREFLTALNLNPGDYNTWYNLSELWMDRSQQSSGDKQKQWRRKALEGYLTALRYNPSHSLAHFRAGVLLQGNNQFKESIRHFQKAVDNEPENTKYLIHIAISYENLGKKHTARSFLQKAFEIDPLNKIVLQKLRMLSELS